MLLFFIRCLESEVFLTILGPHASYVKLFVLRNAKVLMGQPLETNLKRDAFSLQEENLSVEMIAVLGYT